ncbi:MAG TPA: GNAT family N-acetyltransferase [Clostridia bacterium]|jgi:predicted GNAT family acetyltransferase|nr:N-acetyltransferase [Clostridia bacterium]NLV34403.1 N-acetyltransferase [Clostridiaceae bacterium]MDD4502647.1 GNAT family N-acetyltransferase [Clostridia bacterium]HPB16237.1 GNAT family N-acetyltransferase [Clostridia bacterium]HQM96238.1 GNAT family N-acetyltransferase [Clostridia bacterium]
MNQIRKGRSSFYIGKSEDEPIAVISFKYVSADVIIADHTFVSEELRGQGIAKKLLDELADFARKEGLKIIPECSYVKKVFENDPAYGDITKV